MVDTDNPDDHSEQFLRLNAIHIFRLPEPYDAEFAVATLGRLNDPYIEKLAAVPTCNNNKRKIFRF